MRVLSLRGFLTAASLALCTISAFAQTFNIGTDITGSYSNYGMNDRGAFWQRRIQETGTTTAGTRKWEFNADWYFNTWRAPSGTPINIAGHNQVIPPSASTASAFWRDNFGGGDGARLLATTSGNYYTFNITEINPGTTDDYINQHMSVLETNFNPVAINAVTSAWGTYGTRVVTVTLASAPAVGENIFVRYSTDNYVTSSLLLCTVAGTTATATIPTLAQNANVSFYAYSSNRSSSAILTDVTTFGQFAHDLSTLELGGGGSYTMPNSPIVVTSTGGTSANVAVGYATLNAAFTAINGAAVHTGSITIAVNGDTNEGTTTAALNQVAGVTSIGIQPTGGVARTITGATTAGQPLINFNGADNVTINGLNTGGNSLTISNTTVSATSGTGTIRFIADATNNTITNTNIQGSSTVPLGTNGGMIFFGTGTTTGNDNNTISSCNIGPAGSNLPTSAIVGNGSGTSTAIGNSGLQILNNNFIDVFNPGINSSAIYTNGGCNTWTITGNKFFQTATRTFTAAGTCSAINLLNTSATSGAQGHTISNNIIGYASAAQTGTATFTGAFAGKFIGIRLSGITGGTTTSISGNLISGISITGVTSSGTGTSAPFIGILVESGVANVTGNTIGSLSTTGALTFSTNTSTSTDVYGVYNFSSDATTISNNNVGGINATNAGTATTVLYAIRANTLSSVALTSENNVIGGTVSNSISLTSSAAGSRIFGLLNDASPAQINGNTVRNITTNAPNTGTGTTSGVIGIRNAASQTLTMSGNTVHSLSNTTATAATSVAGISLGSATGTISRNFVHSLSIASTSASSEISGISVFAGTNVIVNNKVRLGIDIAGNPLLTGYAINGINDALGTNNYYHNSVYIGGTGVGTGVANTFAFSSSVTTNTREFINNIFVNERSNNTTGGKHYAIRVGGTGVNPTGLTSNYNLLRSTGTGGFIGLFNAADRATIADWRTATGQDNNSIVGNPQFVAPTAATPDLHISSSIATPIESAGTNIASVTVDFDNQTRSGLTPVDMGADAGNFIAQDVSAPNITYTALPTSNCGLGDVTLSSVTITDATGLPSSPSLATSTDRPRIYFRKNSGTWFSAAGTYTSGTATNSIWSFTINATAMGGLNANDVVQYYVIAQDAATTPNVGSNPSAGLVASSVTTVTTHPTTPNSFTALSILNGTYTVGVGGNYTTLTAAINAYNTQCIGGPIVFSLIDNTYPSETFPVVINANAQASSTNTLTIKPAVGVSPTISGSATPNLIRLDGADFVTIDGSNTVSGTTKDLTISNTNTGGTAVTFINDASNNAIRNTILRSVNNNNSTGTILIGAHTTTGNDNITIDNCDLAPGATTPWNAIWSSTGSNTVKNGNITINNCNIYDYFSDLGTQAGINLGTGNNAWTITNNKFYQTATRTFSLSASTVNAIRIDDTNSGSDSYSITGNTIGFTANNGTGTWTQNTGPNKFQAIYVNTNNAGSVSTIANNLISNISVSSTTNGAGNTSPFAGIIANTGRWDINNNVIGSSASTALSFTTSNTGTSEVLGVYNFSSAATTIDDNIIAGLSLTNSSTGSIVFQGILSSTASGVTATIADNIIGTTNAGITVSATGTSSRALGINATNATLTITNNTVSNLAMNAANTGANNSASMIGISVTSTGSSNHTISRNTIFGLSNTASTGATSVTGLYYSGFTGTNTVDRNIIHSLSSASNTGIISGIETGGTGVLNVSNNMIRLGINASGNSIENTALIYGIRKGSTALQSFYYNSVYVGGTNVGTNAINSYAFSRTSGTSADVIRNNIFSNMRANASTGGLHYSIYIVSTTGIVFGNNLYHYNSGSFALNNTTTVGAYTSNWAGTDATSIVGNPNFVNATGAASVVDLHISTTGGSAAESIGVEISGITADIDATNARPAGGYPLGGQVNGGGTAPDAGADEGDFQPGGDSSAPAFTYTTIANTCETTNRTISGVVITDVGAGLPATPSLATSTLRPRIYYRKNAGTWFSNAGTYVSGTANNSTWDFTIIVSDMGGVTGTDNIQYYIIAQDDAGTPNITAVPGTGLAATSVNNVTTHPTNPNVYSVTPTLSGTYTVGVGGNYTTLTAAVNAYNNSCLSGAVTFSLIDAAYPSETFPISIAANAQASATNTLTIKPTITGTTLSGSSASAIILLNGADYVIIDGSIGTTANSVCPSAKATRDLTITNTNTSTSSAVIWLQSGVSINTGATNNIIKNLNVAGNSATTTLVGIGSGSSTISATTLGLDNDNNLFENNSIQRAQFGVISQGSSSLNKNTGTIIRLNDINSSASNQVGRCGIYIGHEDGAQIIANNIANISGSTSTLIGIAAGMQAVSTTTDAGNGVVNATISSNIINTITSSSSPVAGIAIGTVAESNTINISNNMIGGILYSGSTGAQLGSGIYIANKSGATINVTNNTVHLFGSLTSTESKNHGISISSASNTGTTNVQNNIFSNQVNNTSGKTTCIAIGFGGTPPFTSLNFNYNVFYLNGTNTFIGGFSGLTSGGLQTQATLSGWQSTISEDANSIVNAVAFVSNTNLHIDLNNEVNFSLNGLATNLSLTSDIDCDTRTNPYDPGADEFIVPNCTEAEAGTATAATAFICGSGSTTLNATGYTLPFTGISYSWESSPDGVNNWTATGGNNPAAFTTPTLTSDTYYRLAVTCSFGPLVDYSNVIFVDIRPIPSASASSNTPICADETLNLTGSSNIGATFNWTGPNGFASTSQSPSVTNATTAASGFYEFSATLDGCTSPVSTVFVRVNATPAAVSVSPSTATLCAGNSTTLTASGGVTTASPGFPSGSINIAIPDNSTAGITNTISVSGIPAGATITGMQVTFNITHTFPGDIVMNLRAPNNNVLNLINSGADGGDNFINTTISSSSSNVLTASASPYTGIFAATAVNAISAATGQTSNVTAWSSLYSTPNGNYVLSLRDDANIDTGTLNNWTITIFYTEAASYTWSPSAGLSATTGTSVTATPTSTTTYSATVTNGTGCSASATSTVTVNPIVIADVSIASNQTFPVCQGTSVTFTATPANGGSTPTYAWFLNNNPVGSNAPTYTNTSLANGDIVRVEMTSSAACAEPATASSNSITVTVNPLLTWYLDADGDGYSTGATLQSCTQPTNYVLAGSLFATSGDCNDNNDDINPGMDEYCNGIDDDCDLSIDEGLTNLTYYIDTDGDGFGNPLITQVACAQPSGYVLNNTDCNDGNVNVYPGATEQCNGINDDCDGQTDEGCGVINDEPFTALILNPGSLGSCSNYFGTLAGASASAASSSCIEIQAAGGSSTDCPVSGEDVWYYFTANSPGVSIVCNAANNDVTLELHTDAGVLLSTENARTGNGQERLNFTGLTIGETYFVAVRNYNSAISSGGSFQLCVQRLNASKLNLPSNGIVQRCGSLNANWTNANQYIFHISPTLIINGTYAANVGGSGNTILPITNNPNLQYGVTYPNVRVDAVYAVPNGMGVIEMVTVPGIQLVNLVIQAQPSLQLRTVDACPNIKALNAFITYAGNICGPVIDYQWEFTQTAPAAGLPFVESNISNSRYIRVNQIPGVQLGATYSVRIRPVFAGNVFGEWSTTPSCLQVIGAANSPIVKDDNNVQAFYKNEIQETIVEQISIYPNPSDGEQLSIVLNNFKQGKTILRIVDNLGRVVYSEQYQLEQSSFNAQPIFNDVPRAGMYFIEIVDAEGMQWTRKWIVE